MNTKGHVHKASRMGWIVTAFVLVALMVPSSIASHPVTGTSTVGFSSAEVHQVRASLGAIVRSALLDRPLAGIGGPTPTTDGSGAFTTDPAVINNTGINTTITLPADFTPPAKGCAGGTVNTTSVRVCALLGVEEPINKTSIAFIGAAFLVVKTSVTTVQGVLAVALLPNTTFVANPTPASLLSLGQTYEFSILHSTGVWWNFQYSTGSSSTPLTGSAKWENGTYRLNVTEALGIHYNGTNSGYPMQVLAELNTTYSIPVVNVPNAIGIAPGASGKITYNPVSGNAITFNLSSPMGIEGQDQLASLGPDALREAGGITFPGQAVPLWGSAEPLGIYTQQAIAYASEGALAGVTGISTNVTIPTPANITLVAQQGEFIGVQIPVNATDEVGVGVKMYLLGATLTASPYYLVRTFAGVSLYVATSEKPALGSSVTLSASAAANGEWSFKMNGALIQNTSVGAGNGTAALAQSSATAFIGTANASTSLFGTSSLPLLGLFGNGTVHDVVVPMGLEFTVPGKTWTLPDYAAAWSWNSGIGVEGLLSNPALPRGEVEFGVVGSNGALNGGLLWNSSLQVKVAATPSKVNPGENATITANVTGDFAIPEPASVISVSALYGPAPGVPLTFTLGRSSAFYANFSALLNGPQLTSTAWVNLTVNVTVAPVPSSQLSYPLWGHASGSTLVTIFPTQLIVQAHPSSATINAGTNDTVYVWVNDSSGTIAGASLSAVVTPAVPGFSPTFKTVARGEYSFVIAPPASLSTATTYTITIFANKTGSVGAISTVSLTANPLPLLTVSITLKDSAGNAIPASGITSGATFTLVVTVDSGSNPVSGVTVTLGSNPLMPGGLPTGITDSNGQYGQTLVAPKVNSSTQYTFSASAGLSGYRPANTNSSLEVNPPATTASSGIPTTDLYIIVIVVVVAVVAIAAVVMMRKKKSTNVPPPANAEGMDMGSPGPDFAQEPPAQ